MLHAHGQVLAADEHFKKINKAYAVLRCSFALRALAGPVWFRQCAAPILWVLVAGRRGARGAGGGGSDRQKRLAYDSLDTIGDVTPTEEDVAEGGFFEVLRPAFELNARWSTASKVLSVSVCARAVVHRVQPLPTTTISSIKMVTATSAAPSLSFDVSRTGVPVLVKISYFPNWQVAGAAGPWRVTPNLMVVVPTSTMKTGMSGTVRAMSRALSQLANTTTPTTASGTPTRRAISSVRERPRWAWSRGIDTSLQAAPAILPVFLDGPHGTLIRAR